MAMRVPGVFATAFEPDGEPVGTAVLVPGRGYPPMAPLLFFAGFALVQHGWRVEHHWWDPPAYESDEQTLAWVRGEVEAVLPTSGRVLVVGKSLGTLAAPVAAERGLPAAWLTPVLDLRAVAAAIAANPAPQLLVGGSADDLWVGDTVRDLAGQTCEVQEVADADHVLMVPGDAVRGVAAHVEAIGALDRWLGRLAID
jgi:predicted alpha/beta-hydrolase family hydrolase